MPGDRWSRIEALFGALLDRPRDEREALLAELCGDDHELAGEVRSLLAADARNAALLPEPAAVPELEAGHRLGPYRVLRPLGRGGSAAVYLAARDDLAFDRLVAVKIVAETEASAEVVARFLAERRILAALDHPNVARLLDAGRTDDGLLYLVLEWVEGEPIDRYCDRLRLPVGRRVRLVETLCGAVQAAHQRLVVHRDIKPANVLVTADGEPKLLDFGIAASLAAQRLAPGSLLGAELLASTPGYASPEQVRGWRVGTASDVYALGVLLYRLLSGRRPPQPAGRGAPEAPPPSIAAVTGDDAGERARHRATSPAALRRELAGDLDAIVLRALSEEPARRYPSAERLAADLERWRRRLPVRARAGGAVYRLGKLLRRRWAAAGVAVVSLAVLVALIAALAVQASRLAGERDRAAGERDQARRVASFLEEIFELADPERSAGETVAAREILDRGAERIPAELGDRPELEAELLHTVGTVYGNLGLYARGAELVERALAIRRRVFGYRHPAVAESADRLGKIRYLQGDYAASASHHRLAVALFAAELGARHPRVAESMSNLAAALRRQNRMAEAERLYRDALDIFRRAGAEEHVEAARALSNLAVLLHMRGDLAEAESLHRRALALRRRLLGPEHPDVARSLNYLGVTLRERGADEEAETLLRQALELHTELWGPDHPEVSWAHHDLAGLLRRRGDLAGAESHLRQALEIQRRRLGEDHPDYAGILNELGLLRLERGDLAGAEALIASALGIYRSAFGDDHPHVAVVLSNHGLVAERVEAAAPTASGG